MYLNVLLNSGASKGGLDMLTKVMGLELGPHKVCEYYYYELATNVCSFVRFS